MAYNRYDIANGNLFTRITRKVGKGMAKRGWFNGMRLLGLRLCGFQIGRDVYIGEELLITLPVSERSCSLHIGNRVAIAPRVTIILASDPNYSRLSSFYHPVRSSISLEDDCWIGAGAIIHPAITIGECAIVGAGSVVTKSVAPYTIVAGVPAVVIGKVNTERKNGALKSLN